MLSSLGINVPSSAACSGCGNAAGTANGSYWTTDATLGVCQLSSASDFLGALLAGVPETPLVSAGVDWTVPGSAVTGDWAVLSGVAASEPPNCRYNTPPSATVNTPTRIILAGVMPACCTQVALLST